MKSFNKAFAGERTDGEIRSVAAAISEDIEKGVIQLADLSIRNLTESVFGADAVSAAFARNGDFARELRDEVSPVRLSAFSNITGTLIQRAGYEAYSKPEFIGDQLVTAETDNEDNVEIGGIADIDDDAMVVPEGGEIPTVKMDEDYIKVPGSVKIGLRIGLTREVIFFDKTGDLIKKAATIGDRIAKNKEVRILRTVYGIDNTFKRKGIDRNTYVASADPRINHFAASALVDFNSINNAEQGFAAYEDDRTVGEPISVMADTIVIPGTMAWTARAILNATSVETTVGTSVTHGPNLAAGAVKVITSPWIVWVLVKFGGYSLADARKLWLYGNPKKAFRYRTLFPFKMEQASATSDDAFSREVLMQWKATERGVAYVWAPWYVARHQG